MLRKSEQIVFDLLKYRGWDELSPDLKQNVIGLATETIKLYMYQNTIDGEDVWTLEIRPLNNIEYIDKFVSNVLHVMQTQSMQDDDQQNIKHFDIRFSPSKDATNTKKCLMHIYMSNGRTADQKTQVLQVITQEIRNMVDLHRHNRRINYETLEEQNGHVVKQKIELQIQPHMPSSL